MKFDTIIIGGGLSGLICGIRLQEEGQCCAIISSGQSALHFSSGSLDLLNKLPDGTEVYTPKDSMEKLEKSHPYQRIGTENAIRYAYQVPDFMKRCGITVKGNIERNHYRITPMGILKQTWLSFDDFSPFLSTEEFPFKKVSIINFKGFLDFYVDFIADSLEKKGVKCITSSISMPTIEKLRENPTEMRATNIAKVFDVLEYIDLLVEKMRPLCSSSDAVVLPAVFGLSSPGPMNYLKQKMNKPLYLIATMPPSVPGIRAQQLLTHRFNSLGGTFMTGDTVERGIFKGTTIESILTFNHNDIEMSARNFVLATGSFFSKGIIARPDSIYEPIFNVEVTYDPEREKWYDENIFSPQPYLGFGVKTDANFHPFRQGEVLENLYAIGSILSGHDPLQEGCGGGVSILTGMAIADKILNQTKI